jgi:DNA modification methylase
MRGAAVVIRGDARNVPLPDASVDLIVTSPPYFSQRSYTDDGKHYDGQIGSESTTREYIDMLIRCTREWTRVLKPEGSMFVNLGDKYGRGTRTTIHGTGSKTGYVDGGGPGACIPTGQDKSLMGMPWRYALACMDELGLVLRRDIIWSKLNGIPESVQDRVRTSHEYIFHLVTQQRYFTAVDEIREDHAPESFTRFAPGQKQAGLSRRSDYDGQRGHTFGLENSLHPLGKLPGSVWEFPLQPLVGPACRLVWDGRTIRWFPTWADGEKHMRMLAREWWAWPPGSGRPSLRPEAAHYAAFPMELPRRIIKGFSPDGICLACGEGRRPLGAIIHTVSSGSADRVIPLSRDAVHGTDRRSGHKLVRTHGITGYACACPDTSAPTRPAVVLDPFGGTGCTAMVAAANDRIGVTVDYSHTYSRFARWRTGDASERAKAMQVRKPPPPPDTRQEALFDMEEL